MTNKFEIPGRVTLATGNGGLPKLDIKTDHSTAEVYLHGAHVTGFQKNSEPPILWMSAASQFLPDKPIRGGVPIIFPWFGPKLGAQAHGFARLVDWDWCSASELPDGGVQLRFEMRGVLKDLMPAARVSFGVTVRDHLTMELTAGNLSAIEPLNFEACLHTYFNVGDIGAVSIHGLKGFSYLDRLDDLARKLEVADAIRFNSEVDRTYVNTGATVEIHDTNLSRKIIVEKSGSASTVVWNPWIAKSKAMPDFGDEEYQRMVCVESGNVSENATTLEPGQSTTIRVTLSSDGL